MGLGYTEIATRYLVVYVPVLVTEAVSELKEYGGANHPYQCEGEDPLSPPGHHEDWEA